MVHVSEIRALLAVARDHRKTKRARYDALDAADQMRRAIKAGWSRIEKDFDPHDVRVQIRDYRRPSDGERRPKDGVCKLVKRLLIETDISYPEIVKLAQAAFPGAHTSTKSVASLRRDMMKAGLRVPSRKTRKRENADIEEPMGDFSQRAEECKAPA